MDILMSVSHNSRARESDMKQFYQYCTAIASKPKIKVNKIHHFLKIDMTEVYFLTEDEYEIWCKGRTYIYHGVPYHSGYPIKNDEVVEMVLEIMGKCMAESEEESDGSSGT